MFARDEFVSECLSKASVLVATVNKNTIPYFRIDKRECECSHNATKITIWRRRQRWHQPKQKQQPPSTKIRIGVLGCELPIQNFCRILRFSSKGKDIKIQWNSISFVLPQITDVKFLITLYVIRYYIFVTKRTLKKALAAAVAPLKCHFFECFRVKTFESTTTQWYHVRKFRQLWMLLHEFNLAKLFWTNSALTLPLFCSLLALFCVCVVIARAL